MQNGFILHRGFGLLLITLLGLSAGSVLAQQRTGTATRGGTGTGSTRPSTGGAGGASSRSGGYPSSTQLGEAMISTDPEARKIIIVTDDATFEQMKDVVENLDKPKPQVLIKVVFVEVTHSDDLDLGIEGKYVHNAAADGTGTAGTDFGGVAAQVLTGGGFYSYLNKDLSVTLTALAKKGKTEILSRPSILARNNQQATITIGQEVPFITATRFDPVNGAINTVTYQDIGIILRVTPFISSDGMVEMILSPEISSISDKTVTIQKGVDVAVIDKRSADTVVVTPNGQTVMIGGLLGKLKTEEVRKVPFLGDIPWLGYAFKRTIKKDTKTELLIFMTPYVIKEPRELARMSEEESGRMELAPKAFGEKELNRYLEGIPTKQPGQATPPASNKSK